MVASGPLGHIPGMRWCGESNRYFAEIAASSTRCDPVDMVHPHPEAVNRMTALNSVRLMPVQPEIVRSLPLMSRKRGRIASADCVICLRSGLDHRTDPRLRFVQLPCKHSFHLYCVEEWLVNRSGSCPVCRQAVDTSLAVAAGSC
jgi:hypothetical protein